jgi:hypothetical protein
VEHETQWSAELLDHKMLNSLSPAGAIEVVR